METQNIPSLVRKLRQRLRLTQEQFAHELGVTYSTVNQWENGHRRPHPYLLKRLLEIEGLPKEETAFSERKKGKGERGR